MKSENAPPPPEDIGGIVNYGNRRLDWLLATISIIGFIAVILFGIYTLTQRH